MDEYYLQEGHGNRLCPIMPEDPHLQHASEIEIAGNTDFRRGGGGEDGRTLR
jgi:hypothetical protein